MHVQGEKALQWKGMGEDKYGQTEHKFLLLHDRTIIYSTTITTRQYNLYPYQIDPVWCVSFKRIFTSLIRSVTVLNGMHIYDTNRIHMTKKTNI